MLFTGSAHTADDDFDAVKKAAEQGHVDSQFILGLMYDNGYGVPEDYAEAVRWFRKSAEQGFAITFDTTLLSINFHQTNLNVRS